MRCLWSIAAAAMLFGAPLSARAQAYVGEENSLTANFAYTYAPSGKLVAEDGAAIPNMIILSHTFMLSVDYTTPVPGLAVEAQLPLMALKRGEGSFEHFPMNGPYDDGELHFTAQDFRGGVRYQVKPIEQYLGLAFAVAGSIPTWDYPTFGLTAPGHGLKALHVGGSIARTLEPLLPRLFIQGSYEYTFRERVKEDAETEKFGRNYSEADVQIGYILPANFIFALAANARYSHGGVNFVDLTFETPSVRLNHDRLLAEDVVLAGADLAYSITETLSVAAAVRFFVTGKNTRNQNLFGLFATYQVF